VGVDIELAPAALTIAPGAEAVVTVRVRNTGEVVDQVELTVLGAPGEWSRVEPDRLNLLPGQQELVAVTLAPPRSWTVPAGEHPYAVQAASKEDPAGSDIEEGRVTVEPFQELVAELVPHRTRVPRAGHHDVAIDNLGNHPVLVNLSAAGPDEALDFRWARGNLLAEPGNATIVHLRARPTTRFLRGADKSLPFDVVAAGEEGGFATAPGAVRQRAILAPAVVRLLLLAVVLAVVWAAVIRPRLNQVDQAVARTAAVTAQALAPAQQQLNNSPQAVQSRTVAAQAKAKGSAPGGGAGPTTGAPAPAPIPGGNSALNPAAGPALVAVSFRAAATVTKVGSTTQTRNLPVPAIPSGEVLRISGITFDAAGGDKGTLQIERGGESPTVLLSLDLATLDNLSYQFDQPLEFTSTQPLVVTVTCQACQPSVLFSGQGTLPPPSAPPTPTPTPTLTPTPTPTPTPLPSAAPSPTATAQKQPKPRPALLVPAHSTGPKPTATPTNPATVPAGCKLEKVNGHEYEACPGKPLRPYP
jgi:hypothetical protein